MAMNLRLSPEQTEQLRIVAAKNGKSMQEAALEAVDAYISERSRRLHEIMTLIGDEDKDLLDRLSR